MHELAHARLGRGGGDFSRPDRMDGAEGLRPPADQHAHAIDRGIDAFDGGAHAVRIAQIGLHRHDLPDAARGFQELRPLRVPAGDPDARAGRRKPLDDIAPDEPGAAEHRYPHSLHDRSRTPSCRAPEFSARLPGGKTLRYADGCKRRGETAS